jgi:hypothetical protein
MDGSLGRENGFTRAEKQNPKKIVEQFFNTSWLYSVYV